MTHTIPRQLLSDRAARALREHITGGRWRIGQRLPVEAELATELQVSRGTVREAVRALVTNGMLEVRQGSGTYVRARFDVAPSLDAIRRASLRDQYEVRCALDVEAARLAAVRHAPAHLETIRKRLLALDCGAPTSEADVRLLVERDYAFHAAIVDASQNRVLIETYRILSAHIEQSIAETLSVGLREPDYASHAAVVQAIAARDPEWAERAVRAMFAPTLAELDARTDLRADAAPAPRGVPAVPQSDPSRADQSARRSGRNTVTSS
ncbi:FadR/GntR family transcriptional regulator [Chitinasiproducens palmae]|uniref:DNA-binding transcriptional regulator, FadR family n=1 Tax=Chitinasiproducens palmae TaxID=1770053 RepID=A0A1H2PPD0_9BURK|nr:FadR/GntR family transcriptional regulator [Chitinasiproducens palmae]SDV48142.1 DNA-binding transcriptional regulator, FadR family [Chitinasiproducens palmae]